MISRQTHNIDFGHSMGGHGALVAGLLLLLAKRLIKDPALNPSEDFTAVFGLRGRIAF